MTTVFLHIGMPKCASTSVQNFFHRNDEIHRRNGTCYPRLYREESGYFSHRPLHDLSVDAFEAAVNDIRREAIEHNCHNIFISSEEFLNSLWDREATFSLISTLNRAFGAKNVRILSLLRNQVELVESSYAQFLYAGMFRIDESSFFLSDNTEILGFMNWFKRVNGFNFFSYSDFIGRFRERVPENPFDVYSIEREDLGGRDIIQVLCDKLKLPYPQEIGAVNERVSDRALLLIRYAISRFGAQIAPERRNLIEKMFPHSNSGFSPILRLSGPSMRQVIDSSGKDIFFLQNNFSGKFGRLYERSIEIMKNRKIDDISRVIEEERALVDYIVWSKNPTFDCAQRVKVELGIY